MLPLKMVQAAKSAGDLIGADLCNRRLSYSRAPPLKALDFDAITAQHVVLFTTTIIETGAYLPHRLAKTKI